MGQSEVIRKVKLDGQVAVLFGMKRSEVAAITEAFLNEVAKGIVKRKVVHLDGLGRLHLFFKARGGVLQPPHGKGNYINLDVMRNYCVSFSKAAPLRKAIVERYGSGAKKRTDGKVRSRRVSRPGEPGEEGRRRLPRVRSGGH